MGIYTSILIIFCLESVLGLCPYQAAGLFEVPEKKKCFYISTMRKSWLNAKEFCERYGAKLAKIEDDTDHQVLIKHMSGLNYWIGLNDLATEAKYLWTDNSPVNWFLWSTGQPVSDTNQNCGIYDNVQKWKMQDCTINYYYICQIDAVKEAFFRSVSFTEDVAVLAELNARSRISCILSCMNTADCKSVNLDLSTKPYSCRLLRTETGGTITVTSQSALYTFQYP